MFHDFKISIQTPGLREHVRNNLQAARRLEASPLEQLLSGFDAIADWITLKLTSMFIKRKLGVGLKTMIDELNSMDFSTIATEMLANLEGPCCEAGDACNGECCDHDGECEHKCIPPKNAQDAEPSSTKP